MLKCTQKEQLGSPYPHNFRKNFAKALNCHRITFSYQNQACINSKESYPKRGSLLIYRPEVQCLQTLLLP
jgi:hypothetical protein